MREIVRWLFALPNRAWFNTAFVNIGQNSLWTALSPPLYLFFLPFCSISFLHRYVSLCFLSLSLPRFLHFPIFHLLPFSILLLILSLSLPITHCHSMPPSFSFLFIAATYISILLSFTLPPVSFNPLLSPPLLLKICPSFSINNPTLSLLTSPSLSLAHTHIQGYKYGWKG